jgi:2-desacetyl-2-hydroxyethyl bacteriochlorophyllide A dehydrogenase
MKAAVFHGPRDIRCEEIEKPVPGDGEALLRVHACGICGSDLHTYRHGMFEGLGAPVSDDEADGRVMGHEFSGEVVEVRGASPLSVGDRVCAVGMGGNAEYITITEGMSGLARVFSDERSFEEAATTEPLATSLHAVNIADPQNGETHAILGAGIIGLGALQCIKAKAPDARVIVVDLSDKRLAMATELGADLVFNASSGDPVSGILDATGSEDLGLINARSGGVDVVFDCAGAGKNSKGTTVLSQAIDMVRFGGKVVVVAVFERAIEVDMNIVVRKDIAIHGSWAWQPAEFLEAGELIDSGKIDRRPLISHRFGLNDASDAYETQLQAEAAIKVMITP